MNEERGCEQRLALGAYVVGALDGGERADVEAHLASCEACQREYAQLAPLPTLLGRVREADVLAGPPRPSPALLDHTLAELGARAARDRRRRRLRGVLAVAAAAIIAAGGTAAGLELVGGQASSASSVTQVSAQAGPVTARVGLSPRSWGTAVTVALTGVPPGQRCQLIAVGRDGRSEVAASWQANYQGAATVDGATAIAFDQLQAVRVVVEGGRTLLSVAA